MGEVRGGRRLVGGGAAVEHARSDAREEGGAWHGLGTQESEREPLPTAIW